MREFVTLRALSATGRIANIPSVLANIGLGSALGLATASPVAQGQLASLGASLALAGVSLYLAGNFLNDWADRDWDAVHRPERALPMAVFAPSFYLLLALGFGLLGLCVAAMVHGACLVVALLIGGCIALYTAFHKRSAWSIIAMGLCRALLPVLGFVGFARFGDLLAMPWGIFTMALAASAIGLFCHIGGLSMSARHESADRPSGWSVWLSRVCYAAAAVWMFVASYQLLSLPLLFCIAGLLPYALWLGHCGTFSRRADRAGVSHLLAGIPFVDWMVLLPFSMTLGMGPEGGRLAAFCLLLPPLAVWAGRLLQRLASAT